ncbi:MAG: P1 family peptidase [Actinomycetota bacterium]|nr:P1 family peptidase [Actinomycetota bacterium]
MTERGRRNSLTDVAGLRVGHHTLVGNGYLTGTTVILAPPGGMTAGVDVRGGGPGTRETDLLHPTAAMEKISAIVLTGGSAYGLAAACGVAEELADRGVGFRVGAAEGEVVPIVPSAVLFDLGRGGRFRATPGQDAGRAAVKAADGEPAAEQGCIGAGTGAAIAGLKGGIGTASAVLADGTTVSALVVVNAHGSPVDRLTGMLSGARVLLRGDVEGLLPPAASETAAVLAACQPRSVTPGTPPTAPTVQNTTIGVVATDATLTKAQCAKFAGIAHDGLARAINPVHTLFDGDTMFGVSTAGRPAPDLAGLHDILCAAGDVVTRAVVRGILAATSITTSAGHWPGYTDLAPHSTGS